MNKNNNILHKISQFRLAESSATNPKEYKFVLSEQNSIITILREQQ